MDVSESFCLFVFSQEKTLSYYFCLDLGLQEYRLDGDEYIAVMDEFMEAVFTRWPRVIVQVFLFFFIMVGAVVLISVA